jgi:RNA polymerase sigma factor (sigma-70 family)
MTPKDTDLYRKFLYGLRIRPQDVEDVIQELRLYCYEKKIDPNEPRNWIKLHRRAINILRRLNRPYRYEVELERALAIPSRASERLVEEVESRAWWESLATKANLTPKEKRFFEFYAIQGFSSRESAEKVGWAPASATQRLSRIKQKLLRLFRWRIDIRRQA